jgi:hypothetical protein
VNTINNKSHPNSTTNINNSSGYAGGAAHIQHVNAIKGKSRPNPTTNIQDSSGYAGGAAQIPHVNTINGKFRPNLTINIVHDSSGYTGGGTAKIPQMLNQINMCLKIYFQALRREATCEHN